MQDTVRHLHYSMKWSSRPTDLAPALDSLVDKWAPDWMTFTEAADSGHPRALLGTGYNRVQYLTAVGSGECAILVNLARFSIKKTWLLELTSRPASAPGYQTTYAPAAILKDELLKKRIFVSAAHLPASVEADLSDGKAHTEAGRAWLRAVESWDEQTSRLRREYKPAEVVLSADWNLNARREFVPELLSNYWPKMHNTWTGQNPARGTHAGGRLIDFSMTHMPVVSARVVKHTGIDEDDHRPFVEDLAYRN